MMDDNVKWQEFRKQLDAKGVRVTWAWQARKDGKPAKWPKQPSDVGQVLFYGNGFQPSVLTAIVIDYGGGGFGLFTDESPLMSDDVDRIAKPRGLPDPLAVKVA